MNIKIKLDEGAILPTRAHENDAGLDLYTPKDMIVGSCEIRTDAFAVYGTARVGSATIDTGVHIEIPKG